MCGERLRGRGLLTGHVRLRNGTLFDGPQGLAGDAVEGEQEPLLGDLRDGIDHFSIVANGQQLGRGGVVIIPNIVVDHLEMPQPFAGAGVKRKQGIAEQISAGPVHSVKVVLRAGGGGVEDAALDVDGHFAPDVDAADGFPGVFGPGLVTELTGTGNGVEGPNEMTVADVVGTDIAGG